MIGLILHDIKNKPSDGGVNFRIYIVYCHIHIYTLNTYTI